MIQIILWFAAAWIALSIVLVVKAVGKRREPITGGSAALAVVVWGVILVGVVLAALSL